MKIEKDFSKYKLKNRNSTKTNTQEWWVFIDPWGNCEVVLRNWKTGHPELKGDKHFIDILRTEKIIGFNDECPITIDDKKKFFEEQNNAQTNKKYHKPIDVYGL